MKYIGVIGDNEMAEKYFSLLTSLESMKLVIGKTEESPYTLFHIKYQPPQYSYVTLPIEELDYIFICEENAENCIPHDKLRQNTVVLSRQILQMIYPVVQESAVHIQKLELILNNIQDGLIVVNAEEEIEFINQAASDVVEMDRQETQNRQIKEIIANTGLPNVIEHQKNEFNQVLDLSNEKQIISTRIPLINAEQRLIGAFALFKDKNEVQQLAEENTDLKEIKKMLEAIIYSSDEAISVVDEDGKGLMINPAYTRMTGLTEKDIIGKSATVDISEGESVHLKVLQTRRHVRGAKMKVGPQKKSVIVNVAPVIVEGKLKGSVAVIHDVSEITMLTNELKQAKRMIRDLEANYTFHDIIGHSSEMQIAVEQAKIGARTPATVLLRGESGAGKELFAHAIHNESERRFHKFIRVNCATLEDAALDNELFGVEEETGYSPGLFEEANQGTIFLDEIGELSTRLQVKLLKVIQRKSIKRVEGDEVIPVDVRIITATNKNLEQAIKNQTFREDLYYRLNRLPIFIPSLKERGSDLEELIQYFITKVNQQYGRSVTTLSKEALMKLKKYKWPGNVRELENVICRAIIFMDQTASTILREHLPVLENIDRSPQTPAVTIEGQSLQKATETFEKQFIRDVFKQNEYNKTETAKQLHISLRNLYYKMEKYGIDK
ncbi:MAG TPA: sigma 54-interacting transcriptional regulator [Pseudogracilibacillus sp.]|nr:sigma 54-interacting transcriptional regulator [Pseudogracilibacillus sp.]